MRQRKCKVCEASFEPCFRLQRSCARLECALTIVSVEQERQARRMARDAKAGIKTLAQWQSEAQAAFYAFIRERDRYLPCISCGAFNPHIAYCAAHYLTSGIHSALAFDPLNVHKQCSRYCNRELFGNKQWYRIGLLLRLGEEQVARLEGFREAKHYTIADLKAIKSLYIQKRKELKHHLTYAVV